MDNTQTPVGQTTGGGYSDSDFVDNPSYAAPQHSQPSGSYSDADFVDNPAYNGGQKPADKATINDNDSTLTKFGKGVGGLFEGIGEGVLGTVAGAADIANKAASKVGLSDGKQGFVSKGLHDLAGDNEQRSTAASIGYGGESLLEMMLGDEALKAIPLAKRLNVVSKAMQTLEQSPKLMAALKAGADLLKAGTLSDTAHGAELLKNPIVREALKMAMMQGAQTYVKTSGDAGQATEDALTAGTLGAATGAAVNKLSKVIGKARKGADTVAKMGEMAAKAPEDETVFGGLSKDLSDARQNIDNIFEKAKSDALDTEQNAVSQGQAQKDAKTYDANDQLAKKKGILEDMSRDHEAQSAADQQSRLSWVEKGKQEAQNFANSELTKGLSEVAGNNPVDTESLAEHVNDAITQYEKSAHDTYEAGINGENGIATRLKGEATPVKGSAISKKAGELLKTPDENEHSAVVKAMSLAGDKLDAGVKDLLTDLKKGSESIKTVGEDGKTVVTEKPMKDWTADALIKLRQSVREAASNYQRGDLNRRVLGKLISSIDDTLEGLANTAHDPDVMDGYQKLRANYKQQRALLDSHVADKLKLTDPDKALDDANKYLLGGSNTLAKLDTVRKIIGDGEMETLARSRVADWLKQGPDTFVKEFGKMKPGVQDAFFGEETADKLRNLAETYKGTLDHAETTANELTESAKSDKAEFDRYGKKLYGTGPGPGDLDLKGTVGAGIKADFKAQTAQIDQNFNDAVQAAKDARKAAVDAAGDAKAKALHPFGGEMHGGGFLQKLMEGRDRAAQALASGKVDGIDIANMKTAIGQDKWNDIAKGIFSRAVDNATENGRFDPEKLVKWWDGMNESARREMFDMSNPEIVQGVKNVMDDVKEASSVKRFVKYLGAYPAVTLGTAGAAATLGAHGGGTLGEIVAGLIGLGGGVPLARHTVEWIANHPKVWGTFRQLDKVAGSAAGDVAGKAAKYAPGAMRNIYKGLQGTLSQ